MSSRYAAAGLSIRYELRASELSDMTARDDLVLVEDRTACETG